MGNRDDWSGGYLIDVTCNNGGLGGDFNTPRVSMKRVISIYTDVVNLKVVTCGHFCEIMIR